MNEKEQILTINAGSSSIKFCLFNGEKKEISGFLEKLNTDSPLIKIKSKNQKKEYSIHTKDYTTAVKQILLELKELGTDLKEIIAVGHRFVHGGERFVKSVIIDEEVEKEVEKLCVLAPLHNPNNLKAYRALKKELNVTHVAVFDTEYHQTMKKEHYLYAIPIEFYEKYKIRKYGFHGTSHKYLFNKCSEILSKSQDELKVITCHLGNGASICASSGGNVIDTTMGLTPLEGLVMGTRCGDIDPGVIIYMQKELNLSIDEIDNILNKKSGLLGISNKSPDMRDFLFSNDENSKLVIDIFINRIVKYISWYYVLLENPDAIIFSGGIGENSNIIRKLVIEKLKPLKIIIDDSKNDELMKGYDIEKTIISTKESKVKVMVIPTDEELQIVKEVKEKIK
jgi:acetate kinase